MQEWNDEDFERRLKEFRFRPPRALPKPIPATLAWSRYRTVRLAIAAALTIGVVAVWVLRTAHVKKRDTVAVTTSSQGVMYQTRTPLTLGRLSALAQREPAQFEQTLSQTSTEVLPNVESEEGLLHVLSSE